MMMKLSLNLFVCILFFISIITTFATPSHIWINHPAYFGPDSNEFQLDIDNNTIIDLIFYNSDSIFVVEATGDNEIIVNDQSYVSALPFGCDISATPTSGQWVMGSRLINQDEGSGSGKAGEYFSTNAYMGVKLANGSGTHYAWIQIRNDHESWSGGYIVDCAYETVSDLGISAGVVPEPESIALIFIGVAAIAIRRRLKSCPAKNCPVLDH